MRRTKIVCTIGPATSSEAQLEALILAGMNVARLNFSHGEREEHAAVIERVRALSERLNTPVAILQDLQGPKIRTGTLKGGQPVTLVDGATFTITSREIEGSAEEVSTTYKPLPQDVKIGDRILLDDGLLELLVLSSNDTDVQTRVVHGGVLKEHKGINLPGVAVSAPALTEKDLADLRFGLQHNVDYVALSFVRRPQDMIEARTSVHRFQAELGQDDRQAVPLIAKLEKPEAIAHLDEILKVTDGVMVARGDLGVEMPLEKVPLIQKRIISRCNDMGLPVITATQMLESMITNPRPTRAEASDVANSILDGTDAVMLSGETSIGAYPIDAVKTMARIAVETEAGNATMRQPNCKNISQAHAVSHAARALTEEASVQAIIVLTRSGFSAELISKDRPRTPILAFTPDMHVYNRLALWWGVLPLHVKMLGTTEDLINVVDQYLLDAKLLQEGAHIVIMRGRPNASSARTNYVRLHRVGDRFS